MLTFEFGQTTGGTYCCLSLDPKARLEITVAKSKLKGIGGGSKKRWSMWFNTTIRAEYYHCLPCFGTVLTRFTGVAWLP